MDGSGKVEAGLTLRFDLRLFFNYAEIVSSTCRVSFTDGANGTHTVTVSASSLYEAVALGLAESKKSGFAFAAVGPATRLKVAAQRPATMLEISIATFQAWLDTNGRTSREQAKKVTLRQLLGRG